MHKSCLTWQKKIRNNIPNEIFISLPIEEKLIIDLPILMVGIGWGYSAYMMLNWLEGTGNNVEIPFEFVETYTRTLSVKSDALKEIKNIQFASIWDWIRYKGDNFTSSDASFLMYNVTYNSIQQSYDKAFKLVKSITNYDNVIFGNFNFTEPPPKLNFIRAYSIGSVFGDMDDLGASLGKFSLRLYIKGNIQQQNLAAPNFKQYDLNTSELCCRYVDEFSFNDEQKLGKWKYDTFKPELPIRFDFSGDKKWVDISNENFRNLRNRNLGIGKDYIITSTPFYYDLKKKVTFVV